MSVFTEEMERGLYQISTFLEADIKQILIDDGHRATGALVDSIKNTVSVGGNVITIEGEMLIYGGAVIKGRPAGTKRIPIDALIDYLNAVNFGRGVKETRGVAFHIQKRIFEEGIEPDDFLQKAFDKNDSKIDRVINSSVETALNISIDNLITQAKQFK